MSSGPAPLEALDFTPVIIIGAARSGTNALRDMLVSLPQFATWNCDEINPIWRHGNLDWPDDEIPPVRATPQVRGYIRDAFKRIWKRSGRPDFVVEKTCANTLRVPFVDTVLPEARYIYIARNGYDVVASARKRWRGELELPSLPYFLAKARYAPLVDLPNYGMSFLRGRVDLALGRTERLGIWGPRFAGIDKYGDRQLEEICARQWAACVEKAAAGLAEVGHGRVLPLQYEAFTQDAEGELRRILDFLETAASESDIRMAAAPVRSSSVGKGRELAEQLAPATRAIIAATTQSHLHGV